MLVADRDEWMRRTGPLYPGLVALCALTPVPWPRGLSPSREDLTRAAKWFPAVGATVGLVLVIVCELLLWMGFMPSLVAIIAIGTGVAVTGPGRLRGAVTTIERVTPGAPPPVGDGLSATGALTLIGLLAIELGGLLATDIDSWGITLFASEVMAYWCVLLLLHIAGDSPASGVDAPSPTADRPHFAVGAVSLPALGFGSAVAGAVALLALVFAGAVAILSVILVALAAFGLGMLLRRRFGRLANDSLAAVACLCGLLVLLAFSVAHPATASPWFY